MEEPVIGRRLYYRGSKRPLGLAGVLRRPLKEANKTNVKWGGFIDEVADFDPLFFGISPLEAEQMEPQQRLLMTYAWKAVEEAGHSARSLAGTKTGIFIGTGNTGYSSLLSNVDIEGSAAANMSPSDRIESVIS